MASRPAARAAAAAIAVLLAATGCVKDNRTISNAGNQTAGLAFGESSSGRQVFDATCVECHGQGGSGGVGPALRGESHRKNYEDTVAWIQQPAPPMPHLYPAPLSEKDVEDVATYVQSL